ncbi:MAG: uracil-DNA glycosylase [Bradymonadales bacterium]|nr:MAG: uracil-DNA glycosylase [Bradymonadales bacterium]
MEAKKKARKFPDTLPDGWREVLRAEAEKSYFKSLTKFLREELRSGHEIYPTSAQILRALQSLDLNEVKLCILGQDPYHQPGQAMGLSFAVPNQLQPKPPSLVNIFKEIESSLGWKWDRESSELLGWVEQGVLLLNTVLSVRRGQAFSHRNKGWEPFTDQVIRSLGAREKPVVFLLWGAAAQSKAALIQKHHFVLKSAHPSPLSAHRGFFGCGHFLAANQQLKAWNEEPIDWTRINAGTKALL